MFQDEARFGRINDVRRCWAPKPVRPLCQAMLAHEYTYAYAAVEPPAGTLDTLILPHDITGCLQIFLDEVAARHPQDKDHHGARRRRLACQRISQTACEHAVAAAATLRAEMQSCGAYIG